MNLTAALWLTLFPIALACIVAFLCANARRHIVDDPAEQKDMLERFRKAGG